MKVLLIEKGLCMLNRVPGEEEKNKWEHFCESGTVGDYLDFYQARHNDNSGRIVGDDHITSTFKG